jgi:hypothetical protein
VRLLPILVLAGACAAPDPPAITFDVCQPIAVRAPSISAEQAASLDDAFAMWRGLGVSALSRDDFAPPPDITLEFREAAPAFHGLYDGPDAAIYINLDLDDADQRAIAIAHELGHAFGLTHVAPDDRASVMNPGNLTVRPDDGDRAALDAIWGACK